MLDSSSISSANPADFVVVKPVAPLVEPDDAGQDKGTLRVLHVVNGEYFAGAERVQSHLGRCLPDYGIVADFASLKPERFADMLDEQNGAWGAGYRVEMKHRFDFSAVSRLVRLVRQHDYDLLHAHTPRTAMITSLAARQCGVRWIYHVHSPASRDSSKRLTNWANALIEKRSLRHCDHLITVSNSLRDDIMDGGIPAEKITVVHNGVPGIRPERTSIPVPINAAGGSEWVIGMVALMRPRKGLEVVLEALQTLRETDHPVKLRVIGPFETEEYRALIHRQVESLGIGDAIQWVDFTNNVPAELAKLDAMVLPSLFGEGLPMVVLESMAAAVPVIATRVEGTPEAVTHGVEGLLAEPRDPVNLADQISDLVSGKYDWQAMSEAAFQSHASRFSDHAMARGTAAVYRGLTP